MVLSSWGDSERASMVHRLLRNVANSILFVEVLYCLGLPLPASQVDAYTRHRFGDLAGRFLFAGDFGLGCENLESCKRRVT